MDQLFSILDPDGRLASDGLAIKVDGREIFDVLVELDLDLLSLGFRVESDVDVDWLGEREEGSHGKSGRIGGDGSETRERDRRDFSLHLQLVYKQFKRRRENHNIND